MTRSVNGAAGTTGKRSEVETRTAPIEVLNEALGIANKITDAWIDPYEQELTVVYDRDHSIKWAKP